MQKRAAAGKGGASSLRDLTRTSIGSKGSNNNDYDDDFDELTDENKSQQSSPKNAASRQPSSSSGAQPKKAFISKASSSQGLSSNSTTYVRQYNVAQQHLPSLQAQSIQAELALDDISREVVRLRNQQRAMLKERRGAAREKKQRADSRRQQYNDQIVQLSSKTKEVENALYAERSRASLLERELSACQLKIALLEDNNERLSKQAESLGSFLADKDAALARLKADNEALSQQPRAAAASFEQERGELLESARKNEILAGVLRGQMAESEKR